MALSMNIGRAYLIAAIIFLFTLSEARCKSLNKGRSNHGKIHVQATIRTLPQKRNIFEHHILQKSDRTQEKKQCDVEFKSGKHSSSFFTIPRGGSIINEDVDQTIQDVLVRAQNFAQSLMHIVNEKLPIWLHESLSFVERVTGFKLLAEEEVAKTKKKKKKKKKKNKEETKIPDKKKEKSNEIKIVDSAPKVESNETIVESTVSSPTKIRRGFSSGSSSKKHLERELKSNNPNYRIQRELRALMKSPPPNMSVQVGKNIRVWIIQLKMSEDTVFAGETFRLRVSFPSGYPTVPPSMYFLQPTPRHEHVYTNGDICLSLLGKDWRPTMTAQSLAMSILSILSGATQKSLPMDNARHAVNKPGQPQDDWVYHDDNC